MENTSAVAGQIAEPISDDVMASTAHIISFFSHSAFLTVYRRFEATTSGR
jgi:hypothetical protein